MTTAAERSAQPFCARRRSTVVRFVPVLLRLPHPSGRRRPRHTSESKLEGSQPIVRGVIDAESRAGEDQGPKSMLGFEDAHGCFRYAGECGLPCSCRQLGQPDRSPRQPSTPAANRSLMLTSRFQSCRAGCLSPRMTSAPSAVFWKQSNCSGLARLRRIGEWLVTSTCPS